MLIQDLATDAIIEKLERVHKERRTKSSLQVTPWLPHKFIDWSFWDCNNGDEFDEY